MTSRRIVLAADEVKIIADALAVWSRGCSRATSDKITELRARLGAADAKPRPEPPPKGAVHMFGSGHKTTCGILANGELRYDLAGFRADPWRCTNCCRVLRCAPATRRRV